MWGRRFSCKPLNATSAGTQRGSSILGSETRYVRQIARDVPDRSNLGPIVSLPGSNRQGRTRRGKQANGPRCAQWVVASRDHAFPGEPDVPQCRRQLEPLQKPVYPLSQSPDAPGSNQVEEARARPQRRVNGEIVMDRLPQHIADKPLEMDAAIHWLDKRGVPQRHPGADPEGEVERLRQAPGPLSRAEDHHVHVLVNDAEQERLRSRDCGQRSHGTAKLSLLVKQRLPPL